MKHIKEEPLFFFIYLLILVFCVYIVGLFWILNGW